jgi:transposase
MPQNFIECGREQAFLMPPSLREWLPEDHLAWFVIDAVEEMDLTEFYAGYREDGHGAAAYEPSMMVALLLYAYATRQRSARGIERRCRQDVACRVIAANRVPDHATIARFVVRHEAALGELFGSVLELCARAGLVSTGVVAIDGTKLAANANREANLDYERIAREIVAEAKATDEAEDRLYGGARGDELPEELRTREGRRRWLAEAKRELDTEPSEVPADREPADEPPSMPRGRARDRGRRGWHRDARQRLDERRERAARPIPRSRQARLAESKRRLEEELEAERRADEAYEAYRAAGVSRDGRRFGGGPPAPHELAETPAGKINTTDPDSRLMKVTGGYVQGYNAQAAVNEGQIVLAAEISVDSPDFGHLEPMVDVTVAGLKRAGIADKPKVAVADAGYWHHDQIDNLAAAGIQVLIPPDSGKRKRKGTPRRGWQGGRYAWMRRVLATELGERLYRKRSQTAEPMFGHTKHNRGMDRFHRRGRSAVRTEWRLITATHNLLKLHGHTPAAAMA